MDLSGVGSLKDSTKQREAITYLLKNAERAERWGDMCQFARELVRVTDGALTPGERDLVLIAFSRTIGNLRTSYKTLEAEIKIRQADDADEGVAFAPVLLDYQKQLGDEIKQACAEGLDMFETRLSPRKRDANSDLLACVEYIRLIGDYNFYLAEITGDVACGKRAVEAYKEALALAQNQLQLACTHPSILHVTLNYSVCLKEIFQETKQACQIAKVAFDAAIHKLDDLDEASYKDATLILQLVRDNLTLWTSNPNASKESGKQ